MKYQLNRAMMTVAILLGTLLGLGSLATTTAQPLETTSDEPTDLASIIQRERCLNLTSVTPVVTGEETVGVVAIYDDPSTQRAEDYLELYDSDGGLVAVGWFDKFGIQRLAVDRAFIDGEAKFQGTFVRVVDGDFI